MEILQGVTLELEILLIRNVVRSFCRCHAPKQMNDASDLLQDLGVSETKAETQIHTHSHTPPTSQAFPSCCAARAVSRAFAFCLCLGTLSCPGCA